MTRALYFVMWIVEVLAIVALLLAMALPIQDCARREYFEWRQHPSPETYKAFLARQRQEKALRIAIAAPFGITAVLLIGPLRRYRQKSR